MGTPDQLTVTWTAATQLLDVCTDTVDTLDPTVGPGSGAGIQWYNDAAAEQNWVVAGVNDMTAITTDAED